MIARVTSFTIVILSLILLQTTTLYAQCEPGSKSGFLNSNNVSAQVRNDATQFNWYDPLTYEVPKGSGIYGTGPVAPWIGGKIDGEIGLAVGEQFQWHLQWAPGPLNSDGSTPTDCIEQDRLFEVRRTDIENYNRNSALLTADIRDWPWELGAPVADGDGNLDNYDLSAGDRPDMHGDQMFWWKMHLNKPFYDSNLTFQIEAKVLAYSLASQIDALNNTTFFKYHFDYSGDKTIKDAFIGLHAFGDLGFWNDNFTGVDSLLDLAFIYKENDSSEVFPDKPPALGYKLLQGAKNTLTGEDLGATKFRVIWKGGLITGQPQTSQEYYWAMENKWRDGLPITASGWGRGHSETPANYMFPAEPGEYWSEENPLGGDSRSSGSYREILLNSGPFDFQPNSSQNLDFAIIWSKGINRLDSVKKLKDDASMVQTFHDLDLRRSPFEPLKIVEPPTLPQHIAISKPYPNPSSDIARLDLQLSKDSPVKVDLFDLHGRLVSMTHNSTMPAGTHQLELQIGKNPPGSYFIRVSIAEAQKTFQLHVL